VEACGEQTSTTILVTSPTLATRRISEGDSGDKVVFHLLRQARLFASRAKNSATPSARVRPGKHRVDGDAAAGHRLREVLARSLIMTAGSARAT
jgi:hypothetical protein